MVMDRALAARDARRMWIAISARASLCDHARARGPYSALIEPRTENTEKIAPKQKKHRSQTREQSGRARRKHKKVRQTPIARATVPNPVAI
jgi:hypothetical protein